MQKAGKYFLYLSGLSALVLIAGIILQEPVLYKSTALITAISLAIGLGSVPSLKGYQYTAWIISAVVAGMIFPEAFTKWGPVNLRDKTLILVIIQLVMFGMGTHMSLKDFSGLASTGKGVMVGLFCHFSIMPLMGLLLTKVFDFEPEIAAGIILIGSCSSGLASNVMVYLAKANLVLSVIVTAMATLVAPLLTPLLMKSLAGTLIEIKFVDMMMEIIKIVLVPIGAALLHDYLKRAAEPQRRKVDLLVLFSVAWILLVIFYLLKTVNQPEWRQSITLSAFFAGAVIAGWLYHQLYNRFPKLDKLMPLISMFGIIYFTTVTTAAGRKT